MGVTKFENHAGFAISNSRLQVVEINYETDQFVLENVDEAFFNEQLDFEKDKETKISALLQGAFNELLIKHPLKSSVVSFTLPFELFYSMQVPYDNTLLHQDLLEQFKWELSLLYPFISVNDIVIQYFEIDRNDYTGYNTALVVAIQRKTLQMLHSFCGQNNLQLKFIDNIHIASDRALAMINPLSERGLVLSIYFSNKFLSVSFSSNSKPVYFKVIPLNDASEVPELIKNELLPKKSFNINSNIIDAAFITGEDLSAALVQSLKESVNLGFIHFNPFEKIKPGQKLFKNRYYIDKPNSFSSAAGIAFRLA